MHLYTLNHTSHNWSHFIEGSGLHATSDAVSRLPKSLQQLARKNGWIGLQGAQRDVHVLAECLPALVELHHTTSRVVLAMPNDLIAGGLVQDQSSLLVTKQNDKNTGPGMFLAMLITKGQSPTINAQHV